MSDTLEEAVSTALQRVMETSAFMAVWPYQEADGELAEPDVAASMTFCGPFSGRLTLHVAAEVLPLLTQNMLGELDPADSVEEKGRDALRETLNMICGNLLTEWQGDDPIFNLSPPEIVSAEDARAASSEVLASLRFNLENTLAVVEVRDGKC
jgi:CheY-specific phosphatase CheX